MTHNPVAPVVDEEATLYCPVCDYNLTGLIENRCPECGQRFDPEELRRRLTQACEGGRASPPKPISPVGAVAWATIHIVVVWLVMTLLVVAAVGNVEAAPCAGLPILLVGGTFSALKISRRLVSRMAMARAIREGDASSWSVRSRAMRGWSAFILFVLLFMQWIVPAGVLCAYMMSL